MLLLRRRRRREVERIDVAVLGLGIGFAAAEPGYRAQERDDLGDDRGLPDREGEAEGRRVAMGEEDGEGEAEEDGGIGG